jgi:outer membrane protein W
VKRTRGLNKLSSRIWLTRGFCVVFLLLLYCDSATSQVEEGEWMLSVYGGPTMMLTDFNKKKVGWGVEYFPNYGLTKHLSLGLLTGYNASKTEQDPPLANPQYSYLKVHTIPVMLVGSWHFTNSQALSPFVYAGAGMAVVLRRDGLGNYVSDQHVQAFGLFPLGAGCEFFLKKNLSLGFDLSVRVFGTDNVEDLVRGLPDAYVLARLGVSLYHLEPD